MLVVGDAFGDALVDCPLQVGFRVMALDDQMVMDTVHGMPVSIGGDFKDAVGNHARRLQLPPHLRPCLGNLLRRLFNLEIDSNIPAVAMTLKFAIAEKEGCFLLRFIQIGQRPYRSILWA